MQQRLINESILVVRDGKRVQPTIGKAFDLTDQEIKDLERVRPQAISKIATVEVDAKSQAIESEDLVADQNLSKLDKGTLTEIATGLGIEIPSRASNAKLVELIEAARADDDL